MPGKLRKLLNNSRNIKAPYSIDDMSNHNGGLISFEYCGKKYNLAIRENALVFDNDMNLLYTFTFDELSTAETQFLKKVNEEIINHTNQKITLYINRATGIEKLTFTSLFDATYIFNKLKRVSYRSSESIDSIMIEKTVQLLTPLKQTKVQDYFLKTKLLKTEMNEIRKRQNI